MTDQDRMVQMFLIEQGDVTQDGEFAFSMQTRINSGRTVKFVLSASDAEKLHTALGTYMKAIRKTHDH